MPRDTVIRASTVVAWQRQYTLHKLFSMRCNHAAARIHVYYSGTIIATQQAGSSAAAPRIIKESETMH